MAQDKWQRHRKRAARPEVQEARGQAYLDRVDSLVDQQIRAAQEEGKFNNLPGYGKPLPKDQGYDLDAGSWMANRVLKQSGFVPDWVELRKEIAAERDQVKQALEDYREQARALDPAVAGTGARLQILEDRYVLLATAINAKIDQHNSRCPASQILTRFVEDATRRWA